MIFFQWEKTNSDQRLWNQTRMFGLFTNLDWRRLAVNRLTGELDIKGPFDIKTIKPGEWIIFDEENSCFFDSLNYLTKD